MEGTSPSAELAGRAEVSYASLTSRNAGFIAPDLQKSIRSTRLLIAGCGLGGVIAELAVRTGFTSLVLVDPDRVESHNLNRQIFQSGDIGQYKAEALAARLQAINPHASLQAVTSPLDQANAGALVAEADLVVDAIDFQDPGAILHLHRQARRQGKTILAPLAVGWGGAAFVFSPRGTSLLELVGLDKVAHLSVAEYVEAFARMMGRYAERFPEYARRVLGRVLVEKETCPFAQIGPGTFAAASLTIALAVRVLSGEQVAEAPEMILFDPWEPLTSGASSLEPEDKMKAA